MKTIKIICLSVALVMILVSLPACCEKQEADFSEVKAICELATLRCYYHNTAELKRESSGILRYLGNVGYKKAWIEYDGIIRLGIDASQVKITTPEPGETTVKVYVPEAEIMDVTFDSDSMVEVVSESGWFTSISTEERAEAQAQAQKILEERANNDASLKEQATNRAKDIIKRYIINIGKQIGIDYTVEWTDK